MNQTIKTTLSLGTLRDIFKFLSEPIVKQIWKSVKDETLCTAKERKRDFKDQDFIDCTKTKLPRFKCNQPEVVGSDSFRAEN